MDEAFTIHDAFVPPGAASSAAIGLSGPQPLNYWLVSFALRWWGTSEVSVRLLPCLTGIAAVGVLYAGMRRNVGRGCAFLAASFLALSSWHVYWSQNARHYAPMMLAATVAAFAGFEAIHRRRIGWGVVALAALAVATLTHLTAVLLAGALGLFAVWRYAGEWRRLSARGWMVVALLVGGLGTLFMLRAWTVFEQLAAKVQPGGSLPYFLATVLQYVEIPLLVAAGAGLIAAWNADRAWGAFLGAYALVPLAGIMACALVWNVSALYAFAVLPGVCALAAHAATGLARAPLGGPLAGALVALVVLGHQAGETLLYHTHRHGNRPRWREAAAYLQQQGVPPAAIASTGAPALAYYLDYAPTELRAPQPITWLGPPESVDRVIRAPGRQWLVVKADRLALTDPDGRLRAWLADHAVIVAEYPAWTNVKDRTIRIYRSDPAAPSPTSRAHAPATAPPREAT